MYRWFVSSFALLLLLSLGCDKGLTPPPIADVNADTATVLSGRVTFKGTWPPADSVTALAVAAATFPPPYTQTQLIQGIILGTVVSFTLPYKSGDTTYTLPPFSPNPADTIYYVGVAQHYFGDTLTDNRWRVVGFVHDDKDSARVFVLHRGDKIKDANITVNWDSLPRQPFIR